MSETRTVVTAESLIKSLTQPAESASPAQAEQLAEATESSAADAQQESAQQNEQENDGKPKRKPLVAELIKTRHERNEMRNENERLARRVEELEQRGRHPAPEVKEPDPRPQRSQFVTEDDYQEALTDWKVDQKLAERQQAEQQARMQQEQQRITENWQQRVSEAALPDFDQVVGAAEIELPNHLYAAIIESDVGPLVAYHLAQNPDDAAALVKMTPTQALRYLGKLEDRLEQDRDAAKKPAADKKGPAPTPEKSKAPPPIDPLKNTANPVAKPTEKMTYQEYKAQRLAQQQSKRR